MRAFVFNRAVGWLIQMRFLITEGDARVQHKIAASDVRVRSAHLSRLAP